MIFALTHCMVLGLSVLEITQRRQLGGLVQTIEGSEVVARMRSVSAKVRFKYRNSVVTDVSSWVTISAAVDDAKRVRDTYGVEPGDPAQIAVDIVIDEQSVPLVDPSRDFLYYSDERDVRAAIKQIAGHESIARIHHGAWSSKCSDATNTVSINALETAFKTGGKPAYMCVQEARDLFAERAAALRRVARI